MKLTEGQVIECIVNIIDTNTYLKKDENGYYGEIYADYHDEFEPSTIKKIFKANNPRDEFYDILNDAFLDCDGEYYHEVIKTIERYFDDEYDEAYFDEWEDFIRAWVYENVYFHYPYEHYLNQDVCIDIIIDTGDGSYDYTKNELFGCVYTEKGIDDKEQSALLWLMKQQGYSMKQIVDFIDSEDAQGSKFLESVRVECENTTTCMNALTFFVKMSLKEAFDLHEMAGRGNEYLQKEEIINNSSIILKKETPCGLYDPWSGAGSVLDIELEKDVELPLKFVDSILPDGCRGYSVVNIYGMCTSFWENNCVSVKEIKDAA